jgi:hypothetical protein
MKQALISPIELSQTGYRVAETTDQVFEVAPPMFWVECADDVVADQFWYDPSDQTIKPVPLLVPEVISATDQPTTTGAQTL